MLELLVRNAHRAMTRTELLDAIWKDAVVEEGSLSWNVSVLRKTLADDEARIVQTVRGYGYRLGVPVELEAEPEGETVAAAPESGMPIPAVSVAESGAVPTAGGPAATPPAQVHGPPGSSRAALAGTVLLLALAGAATLWFASRAARRPPTTPTVEPPFPRLAVLPFENLSARAENAWIATALSELLATEVAIGGGATTLSGESVAGVARDLGLAAGSGMSRDSIARLEERLGFDLLVAGSYLVVGDPPTLRVDLRLQGASGGETRHVWTESSTVDDLPRLVSRAGGELRRKLGGEPASAASSSAGVSAEALRLYAEALASRRAFKPAAARARFADAVAVAPDFVLARAALAEIDSELGYQKRALAESRRALAGAGPLAPVERLPIEARTLELEGRWAEATARWQEVVNLTDRALEPVLALARAESRAGRQDAARALLDELSARPAPEGSDPRIFIERGWVERYAQRFAEMRAVGKAGVEQAERLGSDYVLSEALSLVAHAELTLDLWEEGLESCIRGEAIAERIGHDRLRARFAGVCGWLEVNQGRPERGEAWFEKTLAISEASGELEQQAGALRSLGDLRLGEGRVELAAQFQERGLALTRESGSRESQIHSLQALAVVETRRAHLERAEELLLEALSAARAIAISRRIAVTLDMLGHVRRLRGDAAGALAASEEAVRVAPKSTALRFARFSIGLARAALASGRPERALVACQEIERSFASARPAAAPPLTAVLLAGRVEAALGRTEAARARLREVERRRDELDDDLPAVEARLDLAELHAALGDAAAADSIWREVLDGERFAEEALARLVARFRLAESGARRDSGPGPRAELDAATAAAAAARLGFLVGTQL
jgi:tetratricopeptide (TPR) repeat protein/TolB-like protein